MLTVIWWRDIPAQVIAKDRRDSHKIVLHPRFQMAIDRAATKAGLKEWNAYLEQWRKEQRICGDDIKAEAEAEASASRPSTRRRSSPGSPHLAASRTRMRRRPGPATCLPKVAADQP